LTSSKSSCELPKPPIVPLVRLRLPRVSDRHPPMALTPRDVGTRFEAELVDVNRFDSS
jgi:hypothetical protein